MEEVALASTALAVVGFLLYVMVYPSGIVLFEALVWSIEAMAFAGISLALKVASSRTIAYRARYEIFRVEALAVILLSTIGIIVTIVVIARDLLEPGARGSTPPLLAAYPLGSAVASYALEGLLESRARGAVLRLVSLHAVASKLRYDVVFEVAGGAGIVLSSILHSGIVESAFLIAVGAYVVYGLLAIAWEHMLYLVGPGPKYRRLSIKERIHAEARRLGLRVARSRVEVYGTFAEAEVWTPLSPKTTLEEAHRRARELARHLIHEIPELLRVIVIPIPLQPRDTSGREGLRGRRHQRYQRRSNRSEGAGGPGARGSSTS